MESKKIMSLPDFIGRLAAYYNKDADEELVRTLYQYLSVFEELDLSKLYRACVENFVFFPKVAELKDYAKGQSYRNHVGSKATIPADSSGKKITIENIKAYGSSAVYRSSDKLSGYTTRLMNEFIETGRLTESMQKNQIFMSMYRHDHSVTSVKVHDRSESIA